MCAGRCREPRRKGTWVADLSGCIVPWAARASCWPQPQQLLPVSAAGSGRRCCTGAFLPAGLFGGSMLFESTRSISLLSSQNKNLSVLYMLRLFGGRGWITRAALLKTAHWAVFTLSSATAPQLFESTLESETSVFYKTKSPTYFHTLSIFHGAKQPKSEPLPSGASLAAISSKVMVFVPSL